MTALELAVLTGIVAAFRMPNQAAKRREEIGRATSA